VYFLHLLIPGVGMGGGLSVVLVRGPVCVTSGQCYTPGPAAGQWYGPGPAAGQCYTPGPTAGQGGC